MMKKLMTKLSILATSVMVVGNVSADVRINGFANLTGGITSSDETLYGYTDKISFTDQSLFAIQVSGDINEKMTATGQIVSRGQNDFDATFEWAYFTYQATDDTSISAGRLRMPLFQYSASLDVAYSYHWVVAPLSVYDVPFNNIDGVRIDHSGYAGDWEYTFQTTFGQINNEFTLAGAPGQLNIDNVIVLNGEFAYESWKFRGVYAVGKASFDIPAFNPALAQLGEISTDLANTLSVTDDTGTFSGLSVSYDNFNWFVSGEYTVVDIEDSFFPKQTAYYATAGIRSGKWTPFITYEKSDLNEAPKFVEQVANFPAQLQVPLTQLIVGIQQGAKTEDSTVSVGVRFDFDTNVALKADLSRQTDDLTDEDVTLMRFAINYVF